MRISTKTKSDLSEFFDFVASFANNAPGLTLVNQETYLVVR